MICPKTKFENILMEHLNNDVIKISPEEIANIYTSWKNEFTDGTGSKVHSETKNIAKKDSISSNQPLSNTPYLLGIDLPTWFNTPDEKKNKIMVLGIDPLRNEQVFNSLNADKENEVIIGTPYAFHLSNMRTGRTKQYWNFINLLSEKNFVYLTDIYKTFFYTDKSKKVRSYNYYQNNSWYSHMDLLAKEIDLIKPDLIISFGAVSYTQLMGKRSPKLSSNIQSNIIEFMCKPVLPMVHLSGSTRQQTKLNFLKANNINVVGNNFGEGYFQIIDHLFLNN